MYSFAELALRRVFVVFTVWQRRGPRGCSGGTSVGTPAFHHHPADFDFVRGFLLGGEEDLHADCAEHGVQQKGVGVGQREALADRERSRSLATERGGVLGVLAVVGLVVKELEHFSASASVITHAVKVLVRS
jgi:hypothetical protein